MPSFDPFSQLKLLELQALDTHLDQVDAKLRSFPERDAAVTAIMLVDQLRTKHANAVTDAADLKLEVAKAEADVDQVRQRAARDRGLLDGGAIQDAKQLAELQHELGSLERRQAELEDIEIEIMQKHEEAQQLAETCKQELADAELAAQAAAGHADSVSEQLAEQKRQLLEQRTELVALIPAELLKIYQKVRTDKGGVAAAELRANKCQACQLELTPVAIAAVRAAKSDELLRCDECRAILLRTANSER